MTGPRVLIVGAGHAGGRVAEALVNEKFQGHVTLVGEEMYPPYERPPLSKQILTGGASPNSIYLRPTSWWDQAGVSLVLGERVRAIDPVAKTVCLGAGKILSYDTLVIATGVRPCRLESQAERPERFFYLRDIDDANRLGRELRAGAQIVIIGAGFIGLEVAAVASSAEATVHVLEAGDCAMPRIVLPEFSARMVRYHEEKGVRFHFGAKAAPAGDGTVRLSTGETLQADAIVVGIGSSPNTDLAVEAGLAVDNGILVDTFGRTSNPDIYAVGDVARHFNAFLDRKVRLESWHNAESSAIAVARAIAGRNQPAPYAEAPWFWTEQYEHFLQCAGLPVDADCTIWRGDLSSGSAVAFQMRGNNIIGVQALNAGRDMRVARKLLKAGRPVSPEHLSDPSLSLQEIARVA